jgi:hypothetical protein
MICSAPGVRSGTRPCWSDEPCRSDEAIGLHTVSTPPAHGPRTAGVYWRKPNNRRTSWQGHEY